MCGSVHAIKLYMDVHCEMTQVGDIGTGVAKIIADPTTAGKVYEFVG